MESATHTRMHEKAWRNLVAVGEQVLAPTYRRPELLFEGGEGCWLTDADGTRYLDMGSGIAVLALGHNSNAVNGALRAAVGGLTHVSNLYHTRPAIELAQALTDRSFADRVFFANSGTEAVEAAVKFARLAAGEDRHEIVYFEGGFHGRTLGALAATDRPDYRDPFAPLPEGFTRAPWNSDAALPFITDRTAAVIVEPVQGEMGVRRADAKWLQALRRRCDETGSLLIFDEIQCGLGRTGTLWAHEATGTQPDLMTLAKPLAGGLPIGAVLMTERVAGALSPGMHGSTFGGGPLVTYVARAVLEEVCRDGFLEHVRAGGETLVNLLEGLSSPLIQEVRGRGLMVGVRVRVAPGDVVNAALAEQLLVIPAGDNVVRFLPPLTVTRAELAKAVKRFERALARVEKAAATDGEA